MNALTRLVPLAAVAIALLTGCSTAPATTVAVERPTPGTTTWSASRLAAGLTADGLVNVTVEGSTTSEGTYLVMNMPEDVSTAGGVSMEGVYDQWDCYLPGNLPADPGAFYSAYVKLEGWVCGDTVPSAQVGNVVVSAEVSLFTDMTGGTASTQP